MKNKAFTLIELLVVVLIIGILAAIAVPQYQMAVAKSHYNSLKGYAHSIKKSMDVYYLANGKYTDNLADLDVNVSRYFSGGYCSVGAITISCVKYELLGSAMEYNISKDGMVRRCVSYNLDVNSASHRLCQQETGDVGQKGSGPWYTFVYK